jgi:hypothetical protein
MFFSFPSSPNDHLQFRDGLRLVPEYLAVMMADIDTEEYTFDEACKVVNERMLGNYLGKTFDSVIGDHMREVRRDGNR